MVATNDQADRTILLYVFDLFAQIPFKEVAEAACNRNGCSMHCSSVHWHGIASLRREGEGLMLLRLQQEMMVINETIPIQINTLWRSMNDERLLKELVQGAMG